MMVKVKHSCIEPEEVEAKLKDAGIQPTAARIAICRYVLCEADHPTAEKVKEWVDKNFPKMSLATVYNTLGSLVQAGLLKELKLPDSESVAYDNNTTTHHHFVDSRTGKIYDIDDEQVDVSLKLKKGFKVREVEVLLRGTRE